MGRGVEEGEGWRRGRGGGGGGVKEWGSGGEEGGENFHIYTYLLLDAVCSNTQLEWKHIVYYSFNGLCLGGYHQGKGRGRLP